MADLIRTAQYYKVQIADKPGTLAALAPLRDAGICLPHAFPRVAARWMWCRKIPLRLRTSRGCMS
jgi:hypothetical protein